MKLLKKCSSFQSRFLNACVLPLYYPTNIPCEKLSEENMKRKIIKNSLGISRGRLWKKLILTKQ